MKYSTQNGIYSLDFELSKLEKDILDYACNLLENNGFQYLSIPSTIKADTFVKQDVKSYSWQLDYTTQQLLGGSAEQGILEYFSNSEVQPMRIYAKNTCFRIEDNYDDLKRVKEFQKVEQYSFLNKGENWEKELNYLVDNGLTILDKYGIKARVRDVTNDDPGYHVKKYDIEVLTNKYGWMETHSCTYFGEEQSKRFGITGATHTISATAIASPRVLIPLIERI